MLELIQGQLRRAWAEGRDAALTFHDGSVLRARVIWVDDVSFVYVVRPLPPARAAHGDVVRVRLLR